MSIVTDAVEWATNVANDSRYGYTQDLGKRWGKGGYDCSSFVISAYHYAFNKAGITSPKDVGAASTRNMRTAFKACGFVEVTDGTLKRGDVLLNEVHHTVLYAGEGHIISATIAETGGIYGQDGDQTGTEICVGNYYVPSYGWDCVLRYPENNADLADALQNLPVLRNGSIGTAVKALQTVLMSRGIDLPLYGADGEFGAETENAVKRFQRAYNAAFGADILQTDGVVNEKVWQALTVDVLS